ncbi:MAG TPA: hypothetical protein PLP05_03100 [Sedimentisphaerales bacterium]|nr:hypothetical protein [Sedimentisphaerales bacterium]
MKKINYKKIRRGSIRMHVIPILIWVVALICLVTLFSRNSSKKCELVGIARAQVHQVASTCSGRLVNVPIELFQEVNKGQTLAIVNTVLENEPLEAQLETIQAEIERLMAELITIQDTYQAENVDRKIDYDTNKRRLAIDVENARLKILETKATIASDRILLGDLSVEFKTTEELLEQDIVSRYEMERAKIQYESLLEKIKTNELLLEQCQLDLQDCTQRYVDYSQQKPYYPPIDNATDVVYKAIKVQEGLLNELFARLAPHELVSPINGIIIPITGNKNEVSLYRPGENVLRRSGEVVTEGEPIFAVTERSPSEIVAYINQNQPVDVKEGMYVEIIKQSDPLQTAKSQITYVSPVLEQTPERLWPDPKMPQWGRPLLIRIHPDLQVVSGEILKIRVL